MLAKKYKSQIKSIINPLGGIFTLEFESLDRPYKYAPGQFLHIALDEEYDGSSQWPDSRCFSMQSNPNEETIRITYAVKGDFTKQMERQLTVGSEVWLKLPYGDLFTQPHNKANTVFIAGGTGITPYLSLFTHESFNKYINPKIYLGFRTKDHHIYHNELERIYQIRKIRNNSCNSDECNSLTPEREADEGKFVKYFYEDTDGLIDIELIYKENGPESNYFISGPPAMIKIFKNTLIENGVPTGNVLTDDWE